MKVFMFILAILTNEGKLEMSGYEVEVCPDKAAFSQVMDKMKTEGKLIAWNAVCIPTGTQV